MKKVFFIPFLFIACNKQVLVLSTKSADNAIATTISVDSICYDASKAKYNVWYTLSGVKSGDYVFSAFVISATDTVSKTTLMPRNGSGSASVFTYESGCIGRIVVVDGAVSDKKKASCKACGTEPKKKIDGR